MRRTKLPQMSAKRRAELTAAGKPAISTFLPPELRRAAFPRSPLDGLSPAGGAGDAPSTPPTGRWLSRSVAGPARGSRPTGPDRHTVEAVLERDHWSCAYCAGEIYGDRGTGWSIGHRRPRGSGGDPRPETNRTANLVTLHGSGTTGCHGEIESQREQAKALGFLIPWESNPCAEKILHALYGWCRLTDRGEHIQIKAMNQDGGPAMRAMHRAATWDEG